MVIAFDRTAGARWSRSRLASGDLHRALSFRCSRRSKNHRIPLWRPSPTALQLCSSQRLYLAEEIRRSRRRLGSSRRNRLLSTVAHGACRSSRPVRRATVRHRRRVLGQPIGETVRHSDRVGGSDRDRTLHRPQKGQAGVGDVRASGGLGASFGLT